MFNTMIGKYVPINSPIHRMNSISKIICLLIFLALLLINDLILLVILTVLTITIMTLSKIPLSMYVRSVSNLKILIVFLLAITIIFNSSWYLTITSIIKIILCVLYTMVLTYTTSKSEITYGLENVFSPLSIFRVPVKQMALSLTLALRFIPVIFEQSEKIMKSQASRGIDFRHENIKGKIIAITSMIVPMFVLTSKRSETIADVMEIRLYNVEGKRTNYRTNNWRKFDENMILLHLGLLLYFIIRTVIS